MNVYFIQYLFTCEKFQLYIKFCCKIYISPFYIFPQDILVNDDFKEMYRQLEEQYSSVQLIHGATEPPKKPKARVHPMVKLMKYIEKHNMRLVDFFNKFDTDHSMSVTREEFVQGIKVSRLTCIILYIFYHECFFFIFCILEVLLSFTMHVLLFCCLFYAFLCGPIFYSYIYLIITITLYSVVL